MEDLMRSELNAIKEQQRETWDRFSAGWKKWDDLVMEWIRPVGEELLRCADLREDSNVLDVAAGTGEPGLTAATRVPKGRVVVTDLAERMLAVAAENAARRGISNLVTKQCDAGELPFEDGSFDAVTCRFGFMFFPDVALAAKEMARVAKPGARVCTSVWGSPDKNSWATTIMSTISQHVDMPPPPPGAPGLFRCAAPGFMSGAFRDAGLNNVAETEVAGTLTFESADQYWDFMNDIAAPVVAGLAKADDAARDSIRSTVLELAQKSAKDGRPQFAWSATAISGQR